MKMDELKRAKEFIKGKIVLDLEDSSSVADWFGKQVLFKEKIETPEQRFAKFEQVKRAQIRQLARNLFKRQQLNLAVIGPFKSEQQFVKLLKI